MSVLRCDPSVHARCLLVLAVFLSLASFRTLSASTVEVTGTRHDLMGTLLQITLITDHREEANVKIHRAFQEVSRLERILSDYDETSELSSFNRAAGTGWKVLSRELWEVLLESRSLHRMTGGAFDITVGPLTHLDRRGTGTPEDLARAQALVGGHDLVLAHHRARLARSGMALDLGGIGKGYALDRVVPILAGGAIRAGFVNFGQSSMAAFGDRAFLVLVPGSGDETQVITLRNSHLSTSETRPGPSPIFDPCSRERCREVRSAWALAPRGALAEGLSTALVVRGRGLLESLPDLPGVTLGYRDPGGALRVLPPRTLPPRLSRPPGIP